MTRCKLAELRWHGGFGGYNLGGKTQSHPRAALAGYQVGGITELDLAAVLFENSADDREPEPSAFFAGRDIGLQ